ncbi:MAG: bacteriochlorophyll 4-vinyl reductase [Gemmobacter sp.]
MTTRPAQVPAMAPPGPGLIGPNAVLQLIPVLDAALGRDARTALFARARTAPPPQDAGMLPEADCAALHDALRHARPDAAPELLARAGRATADYVLAHRIPAAARAVLRALPASPGRRFLVRAIARHAWTFAGSGRFRIAAWRPLAVEIADNPLARTPGAAPVCHWHVAVFARLFGALTGPVAVSETACCATGAPACRFLIVPEDKP